MSLEETTYSFLRGNSDMGERLSKKDWSTSNLGNPSKWPNQLKTLILVVLNSKVPMCIFWGQEFNSFYNDSFKNQLNEKSIIAKEIELNPQNTFTENWSEIAQILNKVYSSNDPLLLENQKLPFQSENKTNWTTNYVPVFSDSGAILGIHLTCFESKNTSSKGEFKESEEKFKVMADDSDILIAISDESGNATYFNKAWTNIIDKPLEDILKFGWVEHIHPDDREKHLSIYLNAFNSRQKINEEFRVIDKDNECRYIVAKGFPWYLKDGTFAGYISTSTDITPIREAEEKAKENDKKFREIVNQAPIGICILRGQDFITDMVNEIYLSILNKNEIELLGKPFFKAIPETIESFKYRLDEIYTTGVPSKDTEIPFTISHNAIEEIKYFNFKYNPIFNSDESVDGIIITASDVTEIVRNKEFIENSEKQLRSLIMESPIPMAIFRGSNFVIEMANSIMFENIWRRKPEDTLGKELLAVFPELIDQKYPEILKSVFNSGQTHKESESLAYVEGEDGLKAFFVDYEYAPIFNEENIVSGLMITLHDVTEKVEARLAIEENEEKLNIIIESAELAIFDFNPKTYKFDSNDRLKEWFGIDKKEEVDLADAINSIKECDKERVTKAIENSFIFENGGNYNIEYAIIDRNTGKERIVGAKGKTWFNKNKEAYRFNGTIQDITEKYKIEQNLKISEQNLRLMIHQAPVAIAIFKGPDFIVEITNKNALELWGKTEVEVHNLPLMVGMPELLNQGIKEILDEVYQTGIAFIATELPIQLKRDGILTTVYINFSYEPLYDAINQIDGIMAVGFDVTDQVTARKKIEANEEKLNFIIDASDLGTWDYDILNGITNCSDRTLEILNRDQNTIFKAEPLAINIHPLDIRVRDLAIDDAFKKGTLNYEARIICTDSSIKWVEVKGIVFHNDETPNRIIGTIRDITKEKSFQQQLQEREAKFRLLADSLPQHVWTSDTEGNLNYFNQSVYDYSGLTPEQIELDGWIQIVHPEDKDGNIEKWIEAIQTGNDFIFEHRFRRHDGEYRWMLSRAIPQINDNGKIQRWVGSSTDIQEQKMFLQELEKLVSKRTNELEQKNIDLEKMNKELQSFAYVSSHDLQEPLRKIQTFSSLILDTEYKNLSEKGQDKFTRMLNSAKKMQRLIQDLLTYSKTNSTDRIVEQVKLSEIVNELKEDLQEELLNYDVQVNLTESCDIEVIPFQFRQLLFNLFTNSIKFRKADTNPIITLDCAIKVGINPAGTKVNKDKSFYHISVTDNGVGFDQKYSDKIFEVFQRVHDKNLYQGTGIGLAIVKKIVDNHNGIITVMSEVNKGTRFEIYIPCQVD